MGQVGSAVLQPFDAGVTRAVDQLAGMAEVGHRHGHRAQGWQETNRDPGARRDEVCASRCWISRDRACTATPSAERGALVSAQGTPAGRT